VVGISPSSNGQEQMVVNGMVIHVPVYLEVGISPSSSGRDKMVVNGIVMRVSLHQLKVSSLRPPMGDREWVCDWGAYHLQQLRYAANKTRSITLLTNALEECTTSIPFGVLCLYHSETSNFKSLYY